MINSMKWYVILFLIAFLFPLARVQAAPEILTADQLRPGMQGYAKTVIEGAKIETFTVEIVGVLKDGKDSDGRIIARVSGAVIDKTGGVLQGMSGSPVYVDGKLIGAVSGGWKDVDNRTCIITPIADMLKLWDMPDYKAEAKIKQVDLKAAPQEAKKEQMEQKIGDDAAGEAITEKIKVQEAEKKETDEPTVVKDVEKPLATPLMVSGFGQAGLRFLTDKLEPFQMIPYAAGGAGNASPPVTIEPGSSIGAQIVRGDISMATIGTVTAVDNGRVLAFGHPFLRKGNVNYFMTDAQIITTASGVNAGFKVGVPGNLVGRVNQDRTAAIAGVMGKYPSVIPLRVRVEDAQFNRKKTYSMQVAYDEDLIAAVITSSVYNAMDQSNDRLGEGSAQVGFEIMTNSAPGGKIKRDNMFYSAQDVGQLAVVELFQALNLLTGNAEAEADIVSVNVDIKIDENRKTASIVEAMPDKPQVKPGETVNLKLKVKPFRQPEEILIVPYKVPKLQAPGPMMLEIRGGGLISLAQLMMQQQGVDFSAEEDKTKPFEVKLNEFLDANKNNEIIIVPGVVLPEEADGSGDGRQKMKPQHKTVKKSKAEEASSKKELLKDDWPQKKQETEYIIDNVIRASLQIVEK